VVNLINQYPRQYPNYPSQPQQRVSKKLIYILIIATLISIVAVAVVLLRPEPAVPTVCGDGVCEQNENCYDCAVDCKCQSNEYCSEDKKCMQPVCGNNICEIYEDQTNCCEDCPCVGELEICNKEKHSCERPTISISDERVEELARNYYTNKGKIIKEIGGIKNIIYQDKHMKSIRVIIEEEEYKINYIGVTESEEVIELPFY